MEAETKKRLLEILKNTGITLLVFALCTGLCYFLDYFKINDLIIYVLGILLTAVFTKGFAYSSLLSVVSVFGYNFFFTIPRFTFHFNDKMYMVTFILMFLVGLGISTVTFQLKRKMEQVSVLGVTDKTEIGGGKGAIKSHAAAQYFPRFAHAVDDDQKRRGAFAG